MSTHACLHRTARRTQAAICRPLSPGASLGQDLIPPRLQFDNIN